MIRFVRDAFVLVALTPLLIAVVVFARTLWTRRGSSEGDWRTSIVAPTAIFIASIGATAALMFVFLRPAYQSLTPDAYAAAVQEEMARGQGARAADVARFALEAIPEPRGELSAIVTAALVNAERCDVLASYLPRPGAIASQPPTHRTLVNLARGIRVCGLRLNDHADAARLLASLEPRPDKREEYDLVRKELGLAPGMSDRFRQYSRAAAPPNTVRGDALIEGVTTHPGDGGREELIVYFRPLSDWKGRRLWAHAYPAGSRQYVDLQPDLPRYGGWRPGELAWEVFQTPDERAFNVYVGVAAGDDLGPAVEIGMVGGP